MASVPRYERLKRLLREKLQSGEFKLGDRFPSQNELMRRYSLSFATVTRALNDLEQEGLLARQQGRGTFVRSIPPPAAARSSAPLSIQVFIPSHSDTMPPLKVQQFPSAPEAGCFERCHFEVIPYGPNAADLDRFLFARAGVDGVLFLGAEDQHLSFVGNLAEMTPTVLIGRAGEMPALGCVYFDHAAAATTAVKHLLDLGHSRIGMVTGAPGHCSSQEYLTGYQSAMRNAGVPYADRLVSYADAFKKDGYAAALDLFDKNAGSEISALLLTDTMLAFQALAALRSMGKQVPADVSVIATDDLSEAENMAPPLTSLRVPTGEMANRAIEVLVELISGKPPRREQFTAELVVRSSTSPPVPTGQPEPRSK